MRLNATPLTVAVVAATTGVALFAGMLLATTFARGSGHGATSQAGQNGVQDNASPDGERVDGIRIASTNLADLLSLSTSVVEATLLSERDQVISIPDDEGGVAYQRVDLQRTFAIVGVLRGASDLGAEVTVSTTRSISLRDALGPGTTALDPQAVTDVEVGRTYLLFLTRLADYGGKSLTGLASDPGIALVQEDGTLQFVVSDGLSQERAALGIAALPEAFRGLTLDGVRKLMSSTDRRP